MPLLVATPAAGCRGMMVCRLTVWCQLLIHGPTEMRAFWGDGEEGKQRGSMGADNAGQRPRSVPEGQNCRNRGC